MPRFVGLDVSQNLTAICVVDETGRRLWQSQCAADPRQIERTVKEHAGKDARARPHSLATSVRLHDAGAS